MHPLDRPVWTALAGAWHSLAAGDETARRLDPDCGPFAAARDGNVAAVAPLLPRDRDSWFVEADVVAAPPEFVVAETRELWQMVADAVPPPDPALRFVALGDADAAEMIDLATLTRPGPFLARTNRLGDFIGRREAGRLIAMAGTRMRAPGFIEVSGVCTHPEAQGRGLASQASRAVAAAILASGARPFLHAYPGNEPAIRLYTGLGFRRRRSLVLTILRPSAPGAR
ncbi:hypothetical protein IP88_10715 [alpha proteobacterium AAP81b]|nr:hypothetical protein IP88_10715 [alpha proteobacterium AAP81b]